MRLFLFQTIFKIFKIVFVTNKQKNCLNACLLLLMFFLRSYYFTALNLTDPFQGLPQGLKGSL